MTFSTDRGPIECSRQQMKYLAMSFFGLLLSGFFIGMMVFSDRHWVESLPFALLAGVYGVGSFVCVVAPTFIRSKGPIQESAT